jgi:hypothetical protein
MPQRTIRERTPGAGEEGHEIAASSFVAALIAITFLATVVGVAPPRANPFGVMIAGPGLSPERRATLARELGVSYFRPWDINLAEWNGRDADTEHFAKAGFAIVMTVRSGSRGARPSPAPSDLESYKGTVGAVLDAYRPAVLCVESEESSGSLYSGNPEQYRRQLEAACEAAHARGVKCANGGLGSGVVAALVWDAYRARGEQAKAEAFLERTLSPAERQQMRSPAGRRRTDEAIRKGKALLAAYQAAGADYVNFHWYTADPRAFQEAVELLRARTRRQAITNEMGQRDLDPRGIAPLLAKVLELELPMAVWCSLDGSGRRALHNPNGTWRENGLAARTLLWRRLPYAEAQSPPAPASERPQPPAR